jgi:hypothetical protein
MRPHAFRWGDLWVRMVLMTSPFDPQRPAYVPR